MRAYDRAMWFGVAFAAASGIAAHFHRWFPTVFCGLIAIHWFLLMAARIVRDGERPRRSGGGE